MSLEPALGSGGSTPRRSYAGLSEAELPPLETWVVWSVSDGSLQDCERTEADPRDGNSRVFLGAMGSLTVGVACCMRSTPSSSETFECCGVTGPET